MRKKINNIRILFEYLNLNILKASNNRKETRVEDKKKQNVG